MTAGKYIVIEGGDGTGKSTQVKLLTEYLQQQNIDVYTAEEPAGTPLGDTLHDIIKDGTLPRDGIANLLLFTTARRSIWHEARQKLEHGTWIVSSRNYLSTLAYQGYGEGVDRELIVRTTERFVGADYMTPSHTIVLTLGDSTERAKRIAKRGATRTPDTFESRGEDFQTRVTDAYEILAAERGYDLIDASRSIDDIQTDIRGVIFND